MKQNYIAHPGEKFSIEWYYDNRGKSDALDYFKVYLQNKKRN